jgi:hypothetical protein
MNCTVNLLSDTFLHRGSSWGDGRLLDFQRRVSPPAQPIVHVICQARQASTFQGLSLPALVRICTHGRGVLTENWPHINLQLTRRNRNREKTQTCVHVSNWYRIDDTLLRCLEEGWPTSTHRRATKFVKDCPEGSTGVYLCVNRN